MSAITVTTSDGRERRFLKLKTAERWAKLVVAESAGDEFAIRASIYSWDGIDEDVRLDGNGRVWIDENVGLP